MKILWLLKFQVHGRFTIYKLTKYDPHTINFDIIAMVKGNCILVSHRTSKIRRIALKIAKAKVNYNNFYGHSKIIAA